MTQNYQKYGWDLNWPAWWSWCGKCMILWPHWPLFILYCVYVCLTWYVCVCIIHMMSMTHDMASQPTKATKKVVGRGIQIHLVRLAWSFWPPSALVYHCTRLTQLQTTMLWVQIIISKKERKHGRPDRWVRDLLTTKPVCPGYWFFIDGHWSMNFFAMMSDTCCLLCRQLVLVVRFRAKWLF